jgi:hypothetical protein
LYPWYNLAVRHHPKTVLSLLAVLLVSASSSGAQEPAPPIPPAPPPTEASRPPEPRELPSGDDADDDTEHDGEEVEQRFADPGIEDGEPTPGTAGIDPSPEDEGEVADEPDGDEEGRVGEEAARREGFLPRLDVFFPEGDLDLRVNRLINKRFFEGQLKYNIVEGDITAFLRYRYYAYRRTYQVTLFDAVEFDGIEELSDEFSRVRGALGLMQWPHDYHRRSFFLAEVDRIISNKESQRFSNNRVNTFVRAGYQIGTPRDGRSNSLVGESRAVVEDLFTPFREIGPRSSGLTLATTYAFDVGLGDFEYLKLEAEALKRFSLPGKNFLIGRIHAGAFPLSERCMDGEPDTPCAEEPDIEEEDRYSIPRSEIFRLDGRDSLKGLSERLRGTYELHNTWEYFIPGFLDKHHRFIGLDWTNWYWVLYGGVGAVGFDSQVLVEPDAYIFDIGAGFESSFRLRKYTFFLSGLLAQALHDGNSLEAKLSIKSYR